MLFIPFHIQNKVFSFFDQSVYVRLQTLQDGWLSCYSSSLGSNPDIHQKYKMGVISKGVAYTLHILAC
jgi:hypothetical protein